MIPKAILWLGCNFTLNECRKNLLAICASGNHLQQLSHAAWRDDVNSERDGIKNRVNRIGNTLQTKNRDTPTKVSDPGQDSVCRVL